MTATQHTPGSHDMEAAGGLYVNVLDPDPDTIHVRDIAHHLGRLCRYTGAVSVQHYSVAEHAVLVADRLADQHQPARVVLAGLHHDDAEAYLGDIARPLKALLPDYRVLEDRMLAVIHGALGLPHLSPDEHDAVKQADEWALSVEAHALMRSQGRGWYCEHFATPSEKAEYGPGLGMPGRAAQTLWLTAHRRLRNAYVHELSQADTR